MPRQGRQLLRGPRCSSSWAMGTPRMPADSWEISADAMSNHHFTSIIPNPFFIPILQQPVSQETGNLRRSAAEKEDYLEQKNKQLNVCK